MQGPRFAELRVLVVPGFLLLALPVRLASQSATISGKATGEGGTGAENIGPGTADLADGGDAAKWTALAHTLKSRYLIHTAEVRPNVYAQVLAESNQGIAFAAGNLNAIVTGNAHEQNFWYQFDAVQRPGYLVPDSGFVDLLKRQ